MNSDVSEKGDRISKTDRKLKSYWCLIINKNERKDMKIERVFHLTIMWRERNGQVNYFDQGIELVKL